MKIPFESVIVINEECHGFIGVARDVPSVIDFLYQKKWLNEYTEVPFANKRSSVRSAYGENWREYLERRTLDELQNIFDGCFYLHEEKVW